MHGKAAVKVKGGKLVRASVYHSQGNVMSVKLGGDFFMYPEDSIEAVEDSVRGMPKEGLLEAIQEALKDTVLYGVSPEDIRDAIVEAMK